MRRFSFRSVRSALVAALSALAPDAAHAQDLVCDPGDLELRAVRFEGNRGLSDSELSRAVATTASAWARRALRLPLGARRCLDTLEFRRDVARLRILYTQRGYHKAQVDTIVNRATPRAVRVTFKIEEGPPPRLVVSTAEKPSKDFTLVS